MRKIIVLLFVCVLMGNLNAQDLKIGVYGAPEMSWLSSNTKKINSEGLKFGYKFGLTIDNYFSKNYAFSSGLSLKTQTGTLLYDEAQSISTTDNEYTLDANSALTFQLDYLNIPLGLKLKTNEIGYMTYFANVGFNTYLNLDGKVSELEVPIEKEILKEEVKFYNVDYFFGLGCQYSLGSAAAISVGIYYNNGFIDVFKDESNTAFTKSVSLNIGMIF